MESSTPFVVTVGRTPGEIERAIDELVAEMRGFLERVLADPTVNRVEVKGESHGLWTSLDAKGVLPSTRSNITRMRSYFLGTVHIAPPKKTTSTGA